MVIILTAFKGRKMFSCLEKEETLKALVPPIVTSQPHCVLKMDYSDLIAEVSSQNRTVLYFF